MNNDVEKVLYTQDQVNQRLDELANLLKNTKVNFQF